VKRWREALALRLAPWLGYHGPTQDPELAAKAHDRQEALETLAEVAYGSRRAAWTSHQVLVSVALEQARREGLR
jgi:hypothetical protein